MVPHRCFLSILRRPSILAVANLLAHNNKSQICYCGQNFITECSFEGIIYFAGDGSLPQVSLPIITNGYVIMDKLIRYGENRM